MRRRNMLLTAVMVAAITLTGCIEQQCTAPDGQIVNSCVTTIPDDATYLVALLCIGVFALFAVFLLTLAGLAGLDPR